MDVTVPDLPVEYEGFRAKVRSFVADNAPTLAWKPRTGMRVPETRADVEALRQWVGRIHGAGYVLERFVDEEVDLFEQRILETELGATGLPYVLGNPLVAGALKTFGSPEQKAEYLPAMACGRHIWTQLFSEPNAGSDLTSLQTRGRLDGDHYVVDGQKVWSTWAQWSDFGYLLARTEPVAGAGGITAFILDMKTPGVDVRPLREMTGTTDFNEVFLDGVRIPTANVIGMPGQGWKVAGASLVSERSGVGSGGLDRLVSDLVGLAASVDRNGRPALESDDVRQDLGRLVARARIHKYLGYTVATRSAQGAVTAADAPTTKVWFSELNLDVAEYGLGLQGPRSALAEGDPEVVDDGRWQDMFLYARAWTIAGGSNEIMRNLIAERGLGLPREPRGDR